VIDPIEALRRAYHADPTMLATCEHLMTVEALLRRVDQRMEPVAERTVAVYVNLDGRLIMERFSTPPCVHFSDIVTADGAHSALTCTLCNAALTEHPGRSGASFPD
jgi:hypothetical protein